MNYAIKLKIEEITGANDFNPWIEELEEHINKISELYGNDLGGGAKNITAWKNCFKFIKNNLKGLEGRYKDFELIFEYSIPGTNHERPDVILLTDEKVIILEFKDKENPQQDDQRDDIRQAVRYTDRIKYNHKVTRDRNIKYVKSYIVCTNNAQTLGSVGGIDILTKSNFCSVLENELNNQSPCSFTDEWLNSTYVDNPSMLQAVREVFESGDIPYLYDVNHDCLDVLHSCIEYAKANKRKVLVLLNGVPGAGKTAVGQSIVFEDPSNAVYLSGNGPLTAILQAQITGVINNGENTGAAIPVTSASTIIQGMYPFKTTYFPKGNAATPTPNKSVLVFDEAQRAWTAAKMSGRFTTQSINGGQEKYSEAYGLLEVGDRIYGSKPENEKYVVVIGLYGNGQSIYEGEDGGIALWEQAVNGDDRLAGHGDWDVIISNKLPEGRTREFSNEFSEVPANSFSANSLSELIEEEQGIRVKTDALFLNRSIRAGFVDCSKWVEKVIGGDTNGATIEFNFLKKELPIFLTRSLEDAQTYIQDNIDTEHPEWDYGIMSSANADLSLISNEMTRISTNDQYVKWFIGTDEDPSPECKQLETACPVFGNQGLEVDCPIVLFGGDFIRKDNEWQVVRGNEDFIRNQYRVLLTRARKRMIILIPESNDLDETYTYFRGMGAEEL